MRNSREGGLTEKIKEELENVYDREIKVKEKLKIRKGLVPGDANLLRVEPQVAL